VCYLHFVFSREPRLTAASFRCATSGQLYVCLQWCFVFVYAVTLLIVFEQESSGVAAGTRRASLRRFVARRLHAVTR
jgi:hypothetical protein